MVTTAPDTTAEQGTDEGSTTPQVRKPLGARLVDAGLLTEAQLDLGLREQRRQGKLLGEVLIELGFVSPEAITDSVASEAQTDVIDVLKTVIDEDVLKLVSYEAAVRHKLIPISLTNGVVTAALADAFNVVAIDALEKETGYAVKVVTAPEAHILEALARHYAQGRSINDTIDLIMQGGALPSEDDAASESPLVRLVDQIIAMGIKQKATDIHVEPEEKILRIRLRVDGVLRQESLLPKPIQAALTARLKLMADLNVTEKRAPQDGRIHFLFGQTKVDLRVSTLPTNHGESVVLRILDGGGVRLQLADLGYAEEDRVQLHKFTERPYGMVLVTGPTGSGKTTTLYTALKQIDAEQRSVFTLEDPIEYSLQMIRQTQVKAEVGMDFANGLRALLRQDPDVILIGEIRDVETAQLASRASLTGHLVLSTLHTNDAVGVIPRLVDMGVERYLLPAALAGIVGQRLVRKICEHCKQEVVNPEERFEQAGLSGLLTGSPKLWYGEGCDECHGNGFKGRLAIYEILELDHRFHGPIVGGAASAELAELAKEAGMRTMLEDGVGKALDGRTTLDEVLRVIR